MSGAAKPELYFYGRRRPPTGVFYNVPLFRGPAYLEFRARVLADLQARPPELFIIPKDMMPPDGSIALVSWAMEHYAPFPGRDQRGPFTLYVRRGGRLETTRMNRVRTGT